MKIWRRSYDIPPAGAGRTDPRYPGNDPRYHSLSKQQLPLTECLKDTVERFLPCWHDVIAPSIKSGKRVLIAAHGNSLRALVKYLEDVPDEEIVDLNIPTGVPHGAGTRRRPEINSSLLSGRRGADRAGSEQSCEHGRSESLSFGRLHEERAKAGLLTSAMALLAVSGYCAEP